MHEWAERIQLVSRNKSISALRDTCAQKSVYTTMQAVTEK